MKDRPNITFLVKQFNEFFQLQLVIQCALSGNAGNMHIAYAFSEFTNSIKVQGITTFVAKTVKFNFLVNVERKMILVPPAEH